MALWHFEGTCVGCGLPMSVDYDDVMEEPIEIFVSALGVNYIRALHPLGRQPNCNVQPSILLQVLAPDAPPSSL